MGSRRSLNDLVRPPEHRWRDRQVERLGGFQVDHQLELRWLLDRQIGRLGALEDLIDVGGRAPEEIRVISTVTNKSTGLDIPPSVRRH